MKCPKPKKRLKRNTLGIWYRMRKKLDVVYLEKRIITCEAKLEKCLIDWPLAYAHLHKRLWYKNQPELLGDFNQTILCCQNCHQKMEGNNELTKQVFAKLRPVLLVEKESQKEA